MRPATLNSEYLRKMTPKEQTIMRMMFVMRKRCVTPFQTVEEETVLAVHPRGEGKCEGHVLWR
jgi:hypothetical protein